MNSLQKKLSSSPKVAEVIEKISGLPTLPAVINQVTQMLQNPNVSANEIGQVISSDQSLASKILKVVNSPFYGFPSRIKTITHAIVILGFNAVKATALSASVFSTLGDSNNKSGFDRTAFWNHSLGVGAIAKTLGKRLNLKEIEEVFLAGLMHDIGKIVLDQYLSETFDEAIKLASQKNITIYEAENEILQGVNHTDIGSFLAHKWNLNEELIHVIENHHNPSSAQPSYQLTCIIHVANALVRCLGNGNSGDTIVSKIDLSAWEMMKIPDNQLADFIEEATDEINKAQVFFNLVK